MQAPRGRWVSSPCVGQPPSARAGHTCATLGDVTYLFGGFDGSARLRDLHAYHHPSTHGGKGGGQWIAEVAEEDCPPARSSHSAVFSHKQMIVFGGYDGAKSLNDLQAYDVGTGEWKELVGRGKAPSPRFGHSAVMHGEDKMYIFGGYDGVDRNDLYCFDFELMQWTAVLVKQGSSPPPRQYHSAVVYEDEMFVFGGKNGTRHYHDLHAFNFRTQSWRAITAESVVKPWPRAGHTAVGHGPLMLIFGGMNGKQNFNDLSVYSIRTNRWTVVIVEGELPAERRAHSAVISNGGHLCVFGGSDGSKRFDDIFSFDLSVMQRQFEEEGINGMSAAGASPASEEGFTPTTPPPKEWRQSRAERRGTVSHSPPNVVSPKSAEEAKKNEGQDQSSDKKNEKSDGSDVRDKEVVAAAADAAKTHNNGESEESEREERRKKKEKEKQKRSDSKRREKAEKEQARRSRQVVAENGTAPSTPSAAASSENASASGGVTTNADAPSPVSTSTATAPSENGRPPATPTSSSSSSSPSSSLSSSPSPASTETKPSTPSAGTPLSVVSFPTTPVKLDERSGSRIALLKARFDASGSSPTSGGIRNISRRSVAYPLSHQSSPSFTADNDDNRAVQSAEVEKLQKDMAELRGKLEERDREVAALKERLDARDAELQKLADGVTKQMRKMKRDLKKLKGEKKGKKTEATKSAEADGKEKKTTKGDTTN